MQLVLHCFVAHMFCRSIMEGVQELTWLLEEQFKPLVHAEMSVLVDVLHRPELLFAPGSEARKRCEIGGFISKCASMAFSSLLFSPRFLLRLSSRIQL